MDIYYTLKHTALCISFVVILSACQSGPLIPDLQISNGSVDWANKTVTAEIINNGDFPVFDEFLVYFDAEESPVSGNYRPQITRMVTALPMAIGETRSFPLIDFATLARPENNNLGNVYQIRVIVDPKNQIFEKNENNNDRVLSVN